MERKDQLSNVAFGGNWSEEILVSEELREKLNTIEVAVSECMDRDVETETLHRALLYVRENVEKGPMLSEAFFRGLKVESQILRQRELERVFEMILDWAGV